MQYSTHIFLKKNQTKRRKQKKRTRKQQEAFWNNSKVATHDSICLSVSLYIVPEVILKKKQEKYP